MSNQDDIEALIEVMARLRDRTSGCPWDMEQDFKSIAPYTIEEAYEVADAIDAGDMSRLKDELGDLLFQVVYHARLAQEDDHFDFGDVTRAVSEKMIARHPHVFGDQVIEDAEAQTQAWEAQKARERAAKGQGDGTRTSALDDLPINLPALLRALKLQKRAARVGFDWSEITDVTAKIREEIGEVAEELAASKGELSEGLKDEFGDLLFVMVNLARHLSLDPEDALRRANHQFERRFRAIEDRLASEGKTAEQSSLEEMEILWRQIKDEEKA